MPKDKFSDDLLEAILSLKNKDEAKRFLRDLLTVAELKEFANRFQAAKLLLQGNSYLTVAKKLKMSTTTVARVAYWLHHGMGGYKVVLPRLREIKPRSGRALQTVDML